MKVDSIHSHNNEVYRLQDIRRVDRRHLERVQDEARIKHQHDNFALLVQSLDLQLEDNRILLEFGNNLLVLLFASVCEG